MLRCIIGRGVLVVGVVIGSGFMFLAVPRGTAQISRDYVSVVGSSTVYPFSTVVAERVGKKSSFKTPKIESTGTGAGFKLFCAGVGGQFPDVTNASRKIKSSEIELCKKNGVTEIVEGNIGYDGIVIASSRKKTNYAITIKDIWLALAKDVPAVGRDGFVVNPYKTWSDVNPSLPATKIEVLGPPPSSGTRDAFVELVMDVGCQEFPAVKALKDARAVCGTIREDGAYIEAGENDNLIVQKLSVNPSALGVFGYSFLEENEDKLHGHAVNGVLPTFETIASGQYPASRPLFFYVKKAHVALVPGLKEYIVEFSSEKASGSEGYLGDIGLIPLPDELRSKAALDISELRVLLP